MATAWRWAGRVVVTVLLAVQPADATHAMDHRYVVLGYVRDASGQPVAGSPVLLVRERTGLAYRVESDTAGFYLVVVHLHDEDVLDDLRVSVPDATLRAQARFNPLDSRRPRGTRIDFTATRGSECHDAFEATLAEYLGR